MYTFVFMQLEFQIHPNYPMIRIIQILLYFGLYGYNHIQLWISHIRFLDDSILPIETFGASFWAIM